MRPRLLAFLWLRAALLAALGAIATTAAAETTEMELKAALVFNFIKYVNWPTESLATTPDSLNICLLGLRDAYFDAIHDLNGKRVNNRNLNVRSLGRGESPRSCQVLVLAESEVDHFESVLKRLEGLPVLTVNGSGRFWMRAASSVSSLITARSASTSIRLPPSGTISCCLPTCCGWPGK